MITEDYVSFETAKLLKEKGFDEPCYQYYLTTKTLYTTFHNRVHVEEEPVFNSGGLSGLYEVSNKTLFEDMCSAPTLQMAMKWLREVHGLHCHSDYDIVIGWYCQITSLNEAVEYDYEEMKHYHPDKDNGFSSPEEGCEEAINYCLKNLI